MIENFNIYLNQLNQKGSLAYEYNPFHNYQTDIDLYEVTTNVGKVLCPKGKAVDNNTGEILTEVKTGIWKNKYGNIITDNNIIIQYNSGELYARAGSLIDLETEDLNFDLNHPVEIEVQPSYDGSVNLILNDDKNIPKLINSRFSVREKNTYEIVDRIGENDTNIYNSSTFDKDTSLYYQYEKNPQIQFLGLVDGIFPVGQYCFYFTYCDADENESDYIAETGLIPVFIGDDKNPNSMDGGIKNQNSTKGVKLKLKNLDKSYNYLKVYYIRYFADYQQNRVNELKELINKIPINSSELTLIINGNEQTNDLDPNILNIQRFNPKSVLTQAQCKNILFFGNIVKQSDNYRELSDCALRIIPSINTNISLGTVNDQYIDITNDYGYYNSKNIYNYTGYFNEEYYRFGVVFIYQNGTLSNVYNTLGLDLKSDIVVTNKDDEFISTEGPYLVRKYISSDDDGWIPNYEKYYTINDNTKSLENVNAKGVCHINLNSINSNTVIGISFSISSQVVKFLKEELGIRGLFFVRQKRIPTILGQCFLLPIDKELEGPVLYKKGDGDKDKYISECFINKDRQLTNAYNARLYEYENNFDEQEDYISEYAYAAICPDFLLNQPYYNQIFNGNSFQLGEISDNSISIKNRFYNIENSSQEINKPTSLNEAKICTVTQDVPTVAIEDQVYRLDIGVAEEAYRFRYVKVNNGNYDAGDEDIDKINESTNIVRGTFSPYLAIYSTQKLNLYKTYNIYQSREVYNINQQYLNRMNTRDAYYAISDRYNFEELNKPDDYSLTCYRGDCYINQFTYRLNRNFNDPSLPNNDEIIEKNTWKDNYDAGDSTKWQDISRSDINAVQMGSWITLQVRSSCNYALRSNDHSYVAEEALMGSPRSFYPRSKLLWRGNNKMPDSYLYNDAYRATLGYKCYFTLEDINYIKNTFSNRIQYSAMAIQDSFKNNYRYSLSTYFRDYSSEYGGITRLIGFEGYLLVIFEHAIGVAVINERILAGNGDGEPVFINTQNVLPEELTIITDTYGTQCGESVVKSEAGFVYGVDTVAKKIWRVKGQQIEILSDFKVNEFLNKNITLSENELYPVVGIKNVKTHYNNNKKDVMFTFYDDVYEDYENVWNLCYNELLSEFVTFYSWVPSYSENIDTQFFSFDRNTSKWLTLLNKSNYYIDSNTGILLENVIIDDSNNNVSEYYIPLHYRPVRTIGYQDYLKDEGSVEMRKEIYQDTIDENEITYEIVNDHWQNQRLVSIPKNGANRNKLVINKNLFKNDSGRKVIVLCIRPIIERTENNDTTITYYPIETIAFTTKSIIKKLTTDFYLHGKSGIINCQENLYPTYWYGETHPFEFEFVVNDKIAQQKIFTNLVIISNKAEPESFHFEVEGDNYEFSQDKRTMYFRQEATKELLQNLGSDVLFDRYYTDVAADKYTQEQYYRTGQNYTVQKTRPNGTTHSVSYADKVYPEYNKGLTQQIKSTIFPLYYERVDKYNDIYHSYTEMKDNKGVYDFKNLSGSEIVWNRKANQFNVVTHIKNSPIDLVGRLRGNSRYKEGKWNVQIPSIIFNQKNEYKATSEGLVSTWQKGNKNYYIPPIVVNSQNIPKDLLTNEISPDKIPNICDKNGKYDRRKWVGYIDNHDWTYRKEAKIRDKWIKIRVRYSGKNLAIIHSLATLYNVSYS